MPGTSALLALLLAVANSTSSLQSRWRYGASIIAISLVVWPTIARPVRTIGLGASRGVHLTNPSPGILATDSDPSYHDLRRYVIDTPVSEKVASYIHDNTTVETRIFSPHPQAISIATGRPNASGFIGHLHSRAGSRSRIRRRTSVLGAWGRPPPWIRLHSRATRLDAAVAQSRPRLARQPTNVRAIGEHGN